MTKITPFIHLHKKYRLAFWLKVLFIFLTLYGFAHGKSEFSELISINTSNEPLVEVLDIVSQASGYEFVIDENWDDLPITVKFEEIPLDQALKRILANVNHAIVYNSDRKVLIRIYEKDSSISRHTGAPPTHQRPHVPFYQSPQIGTLTPPDPAPPEPPVEKAQAEEPEAEESEAEESEVEESEPGESEPGSRKPVTVDEDGENKDDDESSD
jgi:type II secretory pathway component GspD/PulD (secretin)